MKKILLLFTLFFVANLCFSQENGIVFYTITHNWTKKYTSCDYVSKNERERMAYVWGNDNEWTEKAELSFNNTAYRYEEKENEEHSRWRKGDAYIIYRDRENGATFDVMTILNKEYVVQDSIIYQNWKIGNEMKEIADHICMSAVYYDSLKEKEVIAWFALDLPVPLGPNKYGGLPGMILEINEANGALVYTANTVLLSDEKVEIEKPLVKKKRKTITTQEYNAIVNKYIDECKKMQRPYFWSLPF